MSDMKTTVQISLIFLSFISVASFAFEPLPKVAPAPEDNPTSSAKIILGKQLYFDKRLSIDNTVSCNSCHNVTTGGAGVDGKPFSSGFKGKLGGRNAPTVLNAAFYSVQFWDGRAASLEDQAKGPLTNPVEMAMTNHDLVVERVGKVKSYVEQLKKAFPKDTNPVTIDNIAKAIAAYERTLLTPNSPVDKYLKGNKKALSESAVRGMKLVESVGCTSCHSGPNYAGPSLPVGTGFYMKFPTIPGTEYDTKYQFSKDLGRFQATKNEADKNMFRVQSWRNIAVTAPYFHNGSVATLDEAVKVMAKTQLNRELKSEEVTDIVAFLTGLTGDLPKEKEPKIPE